MTPPPGCPGRGCGARAAPPQPGTRGLCARGTGWGGVGWGLGSALEEDGVRAAPPQPGTQGPYARGAGWDGMGAGLDGNKGPPQAATVGRLASSRPAHAMGEAWKGSASVHCIPAPPGSPARKKTAAARHRPACWALQQSGRPRPAAHAVLRCAYPAAHTPPSELETGRASSLTRSGGAAGPR